MKNKEQIIFVLSILGCFGLGLYFGILLTQKEYEDRASELADDVECFSNKDIEHILFNKPAENVGIKSK
jgi:hypothetical protein